jgi:hypothetical protein
MKQKKCTFTFNLVALHFQHVCERESGEKPELYLQLYSSILRNRQYRVTICAQCKWEDFCFGGEPEDLPNFNKYQTMFHDIPGLEDQEQHLITTI